MLSSCTFCFFFFTLSTLNKIDPVHYRCASGFYVDLIIKLSEKLRFTYEIYEVEDKAWGGMSVSGEWNGLMKDLITSKADLAMTSLKITKERSEFIDFSIPFMETVKNYVLVCTCSFLRTFCLFFKGIAIVVSLRPGSISTTAFLSKFPLNIIINSNNYLNMSFKKEPYDYIIWIMLLLVSLHSAAIAIYLFEWTVNKFRFTKKQPKYFFEYVPIDEYAKVLIFFL